MQLEQVSKATAICRMIGLEEQFASELFSSPFKAAWKMDPMDVVLPTNEDCWNHP
jgi:hypothetical protein